MERYTRIAGTRALPLTMDQTKAHLRVDFGADDLVIRSLIEAARDYLETRLGRTFTTTQWKMCRECFPWCSELPLRFPPLVTVDTLKYYDSTNTLQTWASSNYHVLLDDYVPSSIELATGISWPTVYDRPDAVQVTFTAGYGASAVNVPALVQRALLLVIGHWYENREAVITGTISKDIELAVDSICRTLHTGTVAGAQNL